MGVQKYHSVIAGWIIDEEKLKEYVKKCKKEDGKTQTCPGLTIPDELLAASSSDPADTSSEDEYSDDEDVDLGDFTYDWKYEMPAGCPYKLEMHSFRQGYDNPYHMYYLGFEPPEGRYYFDFSEMPTIHSYLSDPKIMLLAQELGADMLEPAVMPASGES